MEAVVCSCDFRLRPSLFYLNVFIYLFLLASILAASHFSGLFSLGIIVPSSFTTGRGQVGNRIYLGQDCAASLFKVAGYGENRLLFVWLETLEIV